MTTSARGSTDTSRRQSFPEHHRVKASRVKLDPEAQALIDEYEASPFPPVYERDLGEVRRSLNAQGSTIAGEPVSSVTDLVFDAPDATVKARLYKPLQGSSRAGLIYLHGGNWVMGGLDSHDSDCRSLANRARCSVVSIDYPLAPEHRFPAALETVHAAWSWLTSYGPSIGLDPERLAVLGVSAGGNLAAALCLLVRDRKGSSPACQVLVYPVTDCAMDTGSYERFGRGYLLSADTMRWSWAQYVANSEEAFGPYASPLRAASCQNLPPALFILAGCDPLRDEGAAYARRLEHAGVPIKLVEYPGMVHTFFSQAHRLETARLAHDDVARYLQAVLEVGTDL